MSDRLEQIRARQGDTLHDIWLRWMAGDELTNRDIKHLIAEVERLQAEELPAGVWCADKHGPLLGKGPRYSECPKCGKETTTMLTPKGYAMICPYCGCGTGVTHKHEASE